ncbi:MAG: hypothetical protein WB686_19780, partial [Pseudolabrys sp.]
LSHFKTYVFFLPPSIDWRQSSRRPGRTLITGRTLPSLYGLPHAVLLSKCYNVTFGGNHLNQGFS